MSANLEQSTQLKTITPTTTSEERTWAALAHGSTVLSLLIGFPTVGLGGVLLVFIPFLIYLAYRDRSKYVAYQAAQAFALQITGTVGFFVAFIVGVVIAAIAGALTLLLMAILIGFILAPITFLLILLIFLAWLAIPFILGVLSLIATFETANGRGYEYPYIGNLVKGWLTQTERGVSPQNLR